MSLYFSRWTSVDNNGAAAGGGAVMVIAIIVLLIWSLRRDKKGE